MTSKQRAYLRSMAHSLEPIFQIGKSSLTPELTKAVEEALEARELIKISVLKNCADDPGELISWQNARSPKWFRLLEKRSLYIRNPKIKSALNCPVKRREHENRHYGRNL